MYYKRELIKKKSRKGDNGECQMEMSRVRTYRKQLWLVERGILLQERVEEGSRSAEKFVFRIIV